MGAELAITTASPGVVVLKNFAEEIVAKLELAEGGKWVLMARVLMTNDDGDYQGAKATLVHDANVEIDKVDIWMPDRSRICPYLQAGFVSKGQETITLQCSTYAGRAEYASIIAFRVDDIAFH